MNLEADEGLVDVDAIALEGFGLRDSRGPFDTEWHRHDKHQLLFAAAGVMHLEVDGARWLLPPQRAAWINAGVLHRVRTTTVLQLRSVYLAEHLAPGTTAGCAVFSVTPLAREMVLHAMRWGPARPEDDPVARLFFRALGALCAEWIAEVRPYCLPVARTSELARAMEHGLARLGQPIGIEDAARAAGLSPRSLARRFSAETGLTWSQFMRDSRMMRAMELLALPNAQVTAVALEVGYDSPAAFSRAFNLFVGERPRDYRRRVSGKHVT